MKVKCHNEIYYVINTPRQSKTKIQELVHKRFNKAQKFCQKFEIDLISVAMKEFSHKYVFLGH